MWHDEQPRRAEVAVAVVRARAPQVAVTAGEGDLLVVQVGKGRVGHDRAVGVDVVVELGGQVVVVVEDRVRARVAADAEDRELEHLADGTKGRAPRSRSRCSRRRGTRDPRPFPRRGRQSPEPWRAGRPRTWRRRRCRHRWPGGSSRCTRRGSGGTRRRTALGDDAQVARVHELEVVEGGVGRAVDFVVIELVHARERQLVEIGRRVRSLKFTVADFGGWRDVGELDRLGLGVAAVARGAQQVVRVAERVGVLEARPGVVVFGGPVVAGHAGLGRLPANGAGVTSRATRGEERQRSKRCGDAGCCARRAPCSLTLDLFHHLVFHAPKTCAPPTSRNERPWQGRFGRLHRLGLIDVSVRGLERGLVRVSYRG